jgi:NAD(P)-dependent dehydrogenase (short-subunit alcohol dehydrogenase family)
MVNLSTVRASNGALFAQSPITAIVVGGASGIGEYVVRGIAATHGQSGRGLRLYIVGRNEDGAKAIIASCGAVCPSAEFRFIKANDLSLLCDVDRVCKEIVEAEDEEAAKGGRNRRIDLLVMTQALFAFGKGLEHRCECIRHNPGLIPVLKKTDTSK